MEQEGILELCNTVRETSFAIHKYLRHGHIEKIYENALVHRLKKRGLTVDQQVGLRVRDEDGTVLGELQCDVVVEHSLLIELKACRAVVPEHVAQLLGYLRGTGMQHGLLINFGSPRLEIRKYILN